MAKITFLYVTCTEKGKEETVNISVHIDKVYTEGTAREIYQEAREKLERVVGKEMADKCYLAG